MVNQPAAARSAASRCWRARSTATLAALAAGASMLMAACRPLYVVRIGFEHLRYMSRAKPIDAEIQRTNDPVRRRKLELVLAAREFARANGLDPGGSYLKVSNTEGLSAGFVVTAALQDRLEPFEWSYPVIGRIPYRGYFKREEAEEFAAQMEHDGYDTYVFAAAGYSTLGWLDDPLPSGLLYYDDVTLVDVVIHELVHQNVYVGSQIEFNETLASAISKRLTPGFFEARGEMLESVAADESYRLWIGQSDVFDEFATRLQRYFAEAAGAERSVLLAGRAEIYKELENRLRALQPTDTPDLETGPILNNAMFLALWRYRKQASLVERYLASFPDLRAAVADLRARAHDEGDPFAGLAAHLQATACCSGEIAVSFLGADWRSSASWRARERLKHSAEPRDDSEPSRRGAPPPNSISNEGRS